MFTIPKINATTQSINWDKSKICKRMDLPLFCDDKISYLDIVQGDIGSCWFLSALISYLRPGSKNQNIRAEDIKNSIKLFRSDSNRDIYKVFLNNTRVYVDDYIHENYHSNSDGKAKCMWYILFEKAMLSVMTATRMGKDRFHHHENHLWVDNIEIKHGEMKAATIGIGYVVGAKTKYYALHKQDTSPSLPYITSRQIYNKFKRGDHILANTARFTYVGRKFPKREQVSDAGAVPTHCYAVINIEYDPKLKTYLLTIANPWGRREIAESKGIYKYPPEISAGNGISIITWERFNHLFACVHASE